MSTSGLTSAEAQERLARIGPNALPEAKRDTFPKRVLRQFKNPLIYILLFGLVFETAVWLRDEARGFPLEGIAIGLLLAVNALLGAIQDQRSDTAMARLTQLAAPRAWVVRDGKPKQVSTRDIVPEDVVRLEAGDRVPADARLLHAGSLALDESILTGESLAIEKTSDAELLAGTLVTRGKAYARVTRTGRDSALGRLASLLGTIERTKTPLETRIDKLAHVLAQVILGFALVLALVGVWLEGTERLADIVIFAVALAVAIVPEELPAVLTLTLALGVERMARRNAIVRRLSAVEALGRVTVICTDKTGTLTQNAMSVRATIHANEARALRAMVVANDADATSRAGDPLELALLDHAIPKILPDAPHAAPHVSVRPFDSLTRSMRVTIHEDGTPTSYLKGAPEVIIPKCRLTPADAERWAGLAEEHARLGERVLALAWGPGEREDDLTLAGLVTLWDPPRTEVPDSIRSAREAGIRVAMVTGDHPATALAIARSVGIRHDRVLTGPELDLMTPEQAAIAVRECDVFARVTPDRKLRIVEALQADGEVVAMTGDGVNDAPALKKADVGIAMGKRGSDVAREAASLILVDDDFRTILAAVSEGRELTDNIQKFLRFMFVIHIAFFLLLVGGAVGSYIVGLRDATGALVLPLTALQILWINMLADGPGSFALGIDRSPDIMRERPLPVTGPLLDRASWAFVLSSALVRTLVAFAILLALPRMGYSVVETQTAIFAYEYLGQVLLAYPSRRLGTRPSRNMALHAATLVGALAVAVFLIVPAARGMLGLARIDARLASIIVATSIGSWLVAEAIVRLLRSRRASLPGVAA
ncbi:MAG: HAD-IC family P-type ATPase [Candidatus Thermoplasmatota archaeon]